jgi:hypothetical protein
MPCNPPALARSAMGQALRAQGLDRAAALSCIQFEMSKVCTHVHTKEGATKIPRRDLPSRGRMPRT